MDKPNAFKAALQTQQDGIVGGARIRSLISRLIFTHNIYQPWFACTTSCTSSSHERAIDSNCSIRKQCNTLAPNYAVWDCVALCDGDVFDKYTLFLWRNIATQRRLLQTHSNCIWCNLVLLICDHPAAAQNNRCRLWTKPKPK